MGTISAKRLSGDIHEFTIIVDGATVREGDGTQPREYTGPLASPSKVRILVAGVPGSQYSVLIDAPPAVNHLVAKHTLSTAAQSVEFSI